ncbi:MAG TPA: alpha/beta fold hydrolase [Gemmatimonadaceae bacterium]|nr:alpha/beta fold hydrolase [Gemmatimonadaceae bacterium]
MPIRATLLVAAVTGLAVAPTLTRASAAPCTTATTSCERWVSFAGGPARSMVYATYALDRQNKSVTRALIMVHGADRNADHYFETATAAGFLAGALGNTIIIAPRFAAGHDTVAANEVVWPARGDSWRSGGMSPTNPTLSSFDFADEILRELANRKNFPNLTHIVVTGHSAGGQFANRYEMSNKVHGTLGGVTVSYAVANPSSYAWPAAVRPLPQGNGDPSTSDKEALGDDGEKVNSNFTYGPFDSAKAPGYDKWPAGLEDRSGYTAGMSDEQLIKQLVERPTTYLLGQVDVLPLGGFDSSPSGMAQGPTRRARGEAFVKYVNETLGAKHEAIIVPECGHNDRCIFTTSVVFPVIFPK